MKKWIVEVVICTLITCSALTIPITEADPIVLLPRSDVTINAEYGNNYWFDFTLSGVSPVDVYDVENGIYHGWCVDKDLEMSRGVNHPVILRSSLDTDLPNGLNNLPWNEINYIINNKGSTSRNNLQIAIWYFTDGVNLSGYDDAQALVDDANENGGDFIPQTGQFLAIPIVAAKSWIQPAFLELRIPPPTSIRGFVWYDTDADGIQDTGENGLGSVIVTLYNSLNVSIDEKDTTTEGFYTFRSFEPGEYYLKFTLKSGHIFTKKDIGNDTTDSDADTTTGKTIIFTVPANQNVSITDWDAGMYKQSSGGTPEPPEEISTPNTRPAADATAGAPYQGFINSNITFDGSRSYDPDTDGRIISYRWNFGDGANGTGEITTHSYTEIGTYNVTLLVTDNEFATDIDTITAQITLGNNPPSAPVLSIPSFAHASTSTQYTVVSTDPDENNVRYIINWGIGPNETSQFFVSGQNVQSRYQWTAPGFYSIQVKAQDTYGANSSIVSINIAIDVLNINDLGYLIDNNGDGIFDQFYNNATGIETGVNQQTSGKYLIDSNEDGTYDLLYDTARGQTQPYSEQPLFQYIIIIIAILVIASLLIFYLMRKRKRPKDTIYHSDNKKQ